MTEYPGFMYTEFIEFFSKHVLSSDILARISFVCLLKATSNQGSVDLVQFYSQDGYKFKTQDRHSHSCIGTTRHSRKHIQFSVAMNF